jgi:CubicO group peptidase (beta-lactamase class C family)
MKKTLATAFLLIFLFHFSALAAQQKNDTSALSKKIDEYITSAFKLGKFNGTVLVAQKGEIMLEKGYGWRNFATRTLNDSNSVFQIGSLTKPFTAMVILKLQEEGKLSVSDRLNKFFPKQAGADEITIQNLPDHTSGLNNYTDVIGPEDSAIISHPVSQHQVIDLFDKRPPSFKPGSKFEYCNSGYFLLGVIIEKLTGMLYEQAVGKLLLTPLHMDQTGFDFIKLRSASKATGYLAPDTLKPEPAVLMDSTVTYAAGAIYSTTGDLYKWAKAIAKGEILSKSSWDEAFTPHLEHYGDGWWIDTLFGQKYITHSGGLQGFMSNFMYYPDKDITIILLNNFGNYGGSLSDINTGISAILLGRPYSLYEKHAEINADKTLLRQYAGTYRFNADHQLIVSFKDDKLFVEASNPNDKLPQVELHATSESRFYTNEAQLQFEFIRDVNGAVLKMVTYNTRGKDAEWMKVK